MRHNRTRPIRDRDEFLCLEGSACVMRQKGVPALVRLLHGGELFIAISSGRGRRGEVGALDVNVSDRIWELAQ